MIRLFILSWILTTIAAGACFEMGYYMSGIILSVMVAANGFIYGVHKESQ